MMESWKFSTLIMIATASYGGTIQWVIDGTHSNLNWVEDTLVCHVWNSDDEFSNTVRLEIQILHNLFR
jgi:hypothetical protein